MAVQLSQASPCPHGTRPDPSNEKIVCDACKAEKKRKRITRWKIMLALFLPSVIANVDTMIVAPAAPTIASHFGRLTAQLNWIFTAYTLTSTSFIPAYGQLADIFGRHAALQTSLAFALLGSTLSAAAQSWVMLLFGRAIQGLSSAGSYSLIKIVLADNTSLEDNAKNNTVFALVSGISFSVGPIVGGYLTDANWRYCFVFPIPIAVLAQIILIFVRKELKGGDFDIKKNGLVAALKTIDCVGAISFIFGTGLIILGITWGGAPYAWDSAAVIVPLVLGSIIFVGFFYYQYLCESGRLFQRLLPKQVPMLPWALFSKKDAFLLSVIGFGGGSALYSAFYFMSIYWNVAEGLSPGQAGTQLLYYTPGLGVGVYLAMFLCNRWPRQTFLPLAWGSIIEAVGMGLLAWAVTTRHRATVNGMMALSGVGTGLRIMPINLHASGIWPNRLAAMLSLMAFCLPFGGTISMGLMGAVFTNKLKGSLRVIAGEYSSFSISSHGSQSLEFIDSLPEDVKEAVRNAAARAVMWAYISILPVMALAVLASLALGNVWIGKRNTDGEASDEHDGREAVIYSTYLKALVQGKVRSLRQPVEYVSVQDQQKPDALSKEPNLTAK